MAEGTFDTLGSSISVFFRDTMIFLRPDGVIVFGTVIVRDPWVREWSLGSRGNRGGTGIRGSWVDLRS